MNVWRRQGLSIGIKQVMSLLALVLIFGVLLQTGFIVFESRAAGADFDMRRFANEIGSQCGAAQGKKTLDFTFNANFKSIKVQGESTLLGTTEQKREITRKIDKCSTVSIRNGPLKPKDGALSLNLKYPDDGGIVLEQKG